MLKFPPCLMPAPYRNRTCRFAINYSQFLGIPSVSNELLKFNKVSHDTIKKEISFELPKDSILHCQFSRTLITEHPNAEKFLSRFIMDNLNFDQNLIQYYVYDTHGINIPLIPNTSEINSSTLNAQVNGFFTNPIVLIGLIGGGYLYWKSKK